MCQRGGILSFGRLDSDHRGIYLDLLKKQLYGFNPPATVHPDARRLKTNDPRVVTKYKVYLREAMEKENLFQRMNDVHSNVQYPLTAEQAAEYEEVTDICGRLMYEAEHQCRKIRAGKIPLCCLVLGFVGSVVVSMFQDLGEVAYLYKC